MLLLALSLFFTDPALLEMPRAEAYLVRENGVSRLEDRFNRLDLWMSQAVVGRWTDDEGRMFLLAQLDVQPPSVDRDALQTREAYAAGRVPMKRVRANADFPAGFIDAVSLLSPCPIVDEPRSPRQMPHGYKSVFYWQNPTNYVDIVCSFRPERTNAWYLATWHLSDTDDYATRIAAFEDQFLRKEFPAFQASRISPASRTLSCERELLRQDARHSVAAYANWHATSAAEYEVLDDLPTRGLVETLTNDFPVMRAKYAAALPTPLDGSNVLCVARLYATRDEYLNALETDGLEEMAWSAAYWSSARRELVAYLPRNGQEELLRTIRHEAFHQYLAYATSMISASPWLNEGYAQYFEDEKDENWGDEIELTEENVDCLAQLIPSLLQMDYSQFYEGTDSARRMKYRLAWSLVRFLEIGADKVRLKPFAGLKERYLKALIETHDMRQATAAAFKDDDLLRQFVGEWKKFWKRK